MVPAIIKDVLSEGIPVTLFIEDETVMLDLNSDTKSHMYLYEKEDEFRVKGRYSEDEEVSDLEDIIAIFVSRYEAKEFGSMKWLEVAEKYGFIEKQYTVTYKTK